MKITKYEGVHNIAGEKIKALRKAQKITQEQIAARMQIAGIQVNQKAVSRMESGDRIVTDYELKRLAEIFGVSADELLAEVRTDTLNSISQSLELK